jgi:hypothetical protein
MKELRLKLLKDDVLTPLEFTVRRMVNAGYVGRDRKAVEAHIEELRREGVPPPPFVPIVFPVLSNNITTDQDIEVIGGKSSGEAEFVLLLDRGRIFVAVGSDHTDREMERHSIVHSKQVCRNVLSTTVWDYEDLKPHWDELLLQSWVIPKGSDEEVLYQKAPLATIISAEEIREITMSKMVDVETDGLVIFSGTVPVLTGEVVYGRYFRSELVDLHLNRTLKCGYNVVELDYLKDIEKIFQ